MEQNHLCATGGFESNMKFSTQSVESPPPKPPRRRFSDQHSPSYLGNNPAKMCYEVSQNEDLQSKGYIGKPAYLSLPASLSASLSNDYDDPYNMQSHASDPSDHSKASKEKEVYRKCFLDSLKVCDCFKKKACHCNGLCDKRELQLVNQGSNSDKLSKNQCDNLVPSAIDQLFTGSCNADPFLPSTIINHCQKSRPKDCHRRHSDPMISHYADYSNPALLSFNFLKDSALKFDWKHCCNRMSHTAKNSNELHDSVEKCSCCKRNYSVMQEIKNLKEINEKLWQHICSLQISLEYRKKRTPDESAGVSVSDLLSSIYYAQKAKDTAIEERLKTAMEERDAALQEIDDLIHTFTRSCDCPDNGRELDEAKKDFLEKGSYKDLPSFLKRQRMLLARINNIKSLKQDNMSYQLTCVTNERNSALEKVRQLEEDIKNMKTCFDLWHSDNKHWETTMLDVLNQMIRQRDFVLSKIDNSLEIGNIKSRLDSVQQNTSTFEPTPKAAESLKAHTSLTGRKQPHAFRNSDEVRKLKEEIFLLNKAIEGERKRREQTEDQRDQFERIVQVLRNKVKGLDVGVHV